MPLVNSLNNWTEALPVQGRALSLRTSFNQSLINSLKYLLNLCDEVIPSHIFSKAVEKLDSLNPESKLSGLLGVIHTDLFKAAERKDVKRVNNIIPRLNTDSFQVENMTYINLSSLNEYYSPFVKTVFSSEIEREYKFFSLSSQDFDKAKGLIQQGSKIVEHTFPDFFKELKEFVGEIVILNGQGLRQGSSPLLFGMIYKSCLFRNEKVTDALDFLIHEQSHLYIHSLNKDDSIILNPHERYESPLREEKRPLIGVYHATFVLARVYYVLTKALDLNEIPEEEKDYCKELLAYYHKRFNLGLDLLQTHAQMTPLGEGLILSASKLVQ